MPNFNRNDVELLNRSIDSLGNTFANNRREDEEQDYRKKMLDQGIERQKTEQSRYDAQQKHYGAMEDKQSAILENAQAQQAIKQANDFFSKQYDLLQKGSIDENQFNEIARNFVRTHYDATHTILQNTEFAPWEDNPKHTVKRGQPSMQLTPAKIGNRDAAIGPKGSVHFTDEIAPADKAELSNLNRQLQDIERQSLGQASAPDANATRNLNTRRQRVEAAKTAILQRYQQGNQGQSATPTGKPITDKQGRKWLYKGSMADPTQDKDSANWEAQ